MSITRSFASLAVVASAGTLFAAPTAVGTWSGQLHLTASSTMPTAQKTQFEAYKQQMNKVKIMLKVSPNGTFSTMLVGGPQKAPPQNGKWTQSGSTVTLAVPNKPGKQSFTLSANGKIMTLHLPPRGGVTGDLVFTR